MIFYFLMCKMEINKYIVNCISCTNEKDFTSIGRVSLTMYENDTIKVVLRDDNQIWLGRCIIVPKEHVSPSDFYLRTDLLIEVGRIITMLNDVYNYLFNMTMSNIAQLGNLTKDENNQLTYEEGYFHTHFHFIPRYHHDVFIYDHLFKDPQFGKPLNIDPKAGLEIFKPSEELLNSMRSDISHEMYKYDSI